MTTEVQSIGVSSKEENSSINYTHSIKLEETAKGLRFHAHVYGIGGDNTSRDLLKTYEDTIDLFKRNGHIIAPMNGTNGANNKI